MNAERAESPPPQTPSLSDLSLGGDGGVHKAKAWRGKMLHTRFKLSALTAKDFKKSCPALFKAVTEELPWNAVQWWENGLCLSRRIYVGIKRNGPSYLSLWLDENHVALSENGRMIVSALEFFHAFTTYDELLEYLKDNNWGELRADRGLDLFPKQTAEEEAVARPTKPEKPKVGYGSLSYEKIEEICKRHGL